MNEFTGSQNVTLNDVLSNYRSFADKHGFVIVSVKDSHMYTMGLSKHNLPDILCEQCDNKAFEAIHHLVSLWMDDEFSLSPNSLGDELLCNVTPIDYAKAATNNAIALSAPFYNRYKELIDQDYGVKLVRLSLSDDDGYLPEDEQMELWMIEEDEFHSSRNMIPLT